MDIYLKSICALILLILLIFLFIRVYKERKYHKKCSLKTKYLFLGYYLLCCVLYSVNYHMKYDEKIKIEYVFTYSNVRYLLMIMIFSLGLLIIKIIRFKNKGKIVGIWMVICALITITIPWLDIEKDYVNFETPDQALEYQGIHKNNVTAEITGEDSIFVCYLKDGKTSGKIVWKTEKGWKSAGIEKRDVIYMMNDYDRDILITVEQSVFAQGLFITVDFGIDSDQNVKITDTNKTVFQKVKWVGEKGEDLCYIGFLGKEKPEYYQINLDNETIDIDWNSNEIIFTSWH